MREKLLKVRVLAIWILNAIQDWRAEVWRKDPNGRYCCNGEECGCYGVTNRDYWEGMLK